MYSSLLRMSWMCCLAHLAKLLLGADEAYCKELEAQSSIV